ncbi:MAG: hypothetical protein Q8S84_06900 [bacterium]|nr:hypothetical protein [bacterium]MDP3381186.1 hypothetical protein [bacterium]
MKILEKLNSTYKKAYITKNEYEELSFKYSKKLKDSLNHMKIVL